ncbi:unnamed protein product [Vitrella brassicaformis CCMP3155]|uniref:RING-type domain-containing protein n=2 Tax=Vitrella brassicaformis TaxID=1169539 RepID=A0A0G4H4V7_VITBC|nr:unnamed protein product [Vitrella brassicaformis CCMP3155]|eukprot:CEM38818.1 unnamed protein product [Vitrella brassicaformis CCMP3155]
MGGSQSARLLSASTGDDDASRCVVCIHEYDTHTGAAHTPLVLGQCGHTFCAHCVARIKGLDGSVKCPTCRAVSREDVIKKNNALVTLLEYMRPSDGTAGRQQQAGNATTTTTTAAAAAAGHVSSRVATTPHGARQTSSNGATLRQRQEGSSLSQQQPANSSSVGRRTGTSRYGYRYEVVQEGTGRVPTLFDTVKIDRIAWDDGFDGQRKACDVHGEVIRVSGRGEWKREALLAMREGEIRRITAPPRYPARFRQLRLISIE